MIPSCTQIVYSLVSVHKATLSAGIVECTFALREWCVMHAICLSFSSLTVTAVKSFKPLKAKQNLQQTALKFFFFLLLSEKIRLDVLCEFSA